MFMMTENKYAFLSSSLVKQIVLFGGNPEGLIPPVVFESLQAKMAEVRERV